MKLLKFITCGSVDDGKSTLIGHILYDSKLLYTDQEKALELDSKVGSREGAIDFSLLLDGLMEEREQGITIDVAYRYFTTDKRGFIVADTPGHEEYTRNMAVGASFADLAVILIDATQGMLMQTRRHARICSLMGIQYFVFAINKMDLVSYTEEKFREILLQVESLKKELNLANVYTIPISATEGDLITKKSENLPWFKGPALLEYLEDIEIENTIREEGFYMPVQRVCRPNHTFRGFQGSVEAGRLAAGDTVIVLPSREAAKVKSIYIYDQKAEAAARGQAVTVSLDREVDVSRGCVLTAGFHASVVSRIRAAILWMDNTELGEGKNYYVKIGTMLIPGLVRKINYSIDINTGKKKEIRYLRKNEIAICEIDFADRVVVDLFEKHRTLGELILIDRVTNMTSACGVVREIIDDADITMISYPDRETRSNYKGQRSLTFEFKAEDGFDIEFVRKVEKELSLKGRHTYIYVFTGSASAVDIIWHLGNAGILTLVLAEAADTSVFSEDRTYVSNWVNGEKTVNEIADLIFRRSRVYDDVVSRGAFI